MGKSGADVSTVVERSVDVEAEGEAGEGSVFCGVADDDAVDGFVKFDFSPVFGALSGMVETVWVFGHDAFEVALPCDAPESVSLCGGDDELEVGGVADGFMENLLSCAEGEAGEVVVVLLEDVEDDVGGWVVFAASEGVGGGVHAFLDEFEVGVAVVVVDDDFAVEDGGGCGDGVDEVEFGVEGGDVVAASGGEGEGGVFVEEGAFAVEFGFVGPSWVVEVGGGADAGEHGLEGGHKGEVRRRG